MGTVAHPQGRLPARVYWFRRTMVLLTALALVFAIGRLLNSGGGSPPDDAALVTASTPTASPTLGLAGPMPLRPAATGKAQPSATGNPVVLAAPDGPCAVDEITVTPSVAPDAAAGGRVGLVLELTGIRPACTFSVSSKSLVAKVTSGKDRIWSSQDCPKVIRAANVVVRSAAPTRVVLPWSGRRSDDTCSRSAGWALPGYYHLTASVIGSQPGDAQFRLTVPPRPVVTKTAHPKKKKNAAVVDSGRRTG
jgi:hypothetical protein